MKTIVLISCTKGKKEVLGKVRAEELYTSDFFKKSLTYAKKLTAPENIYILSDKYYLLSLDEKVEFYDVLLKDKIDWGEKVIEELKKVADIEKDKFVILAGKDYVKPIKDKLVNVELPFDGVKGNGEMLERLDKEEEKIWKEEQEVLRRKLEDLKKKFQEINITGETTEISVSILHELFNILKRFTFPCQKRIGKKWIVPHNGIYIFFEKGETITTSDGRELDRIVRVGTHEKDNRLFNRIDQHFKGNIKSSIFRKDIGEALSTNNEEIISKYMQENLSFVVFEVATKEERLYWEEKIILTLSKAAILGQISPSKKWLGNKSPKEKIRRSGLWQVEGIYIEELDKAGISKLMQIVGK